MDSRKFVSAAVEFVASRCTKRSALQYADITKGGSRPVVNLEFDCVVHLQ